MKITELKDLFSEVQGSSINQLTTQLNEVQQAQKLLMLQHVQDSKPIAKLIEQKHNEFQKQVFNIETQFSSWEASHTNELRATKNFDKRFQEINCDIQALVQLYSQLRHQVTEDSIFASDQFKNYKSSIEEQMPRLVQLQEAFVQLKGQKVFYEHPSIGDIEKNI